MYVDAFLDRKNDKFHIAERQDGKRIIKAIPAEYSFYYEHSAGTRRSIFGHPVKKITVNSNRKFRQEIAKIEQQYRTFEKDVNPLFQYLATAYAGVDAPILNVGFFDIEADFHPTRLWASPEDPFNAITAISLYRSHDKKLLSFVLRPPTVDKEEANRVEDELNEDEFEGVKHQTKIYVDEAELLLDFLHEIEDCDILTGWNSSYYDITYTINRVSMLLGKEATKKFCLFDQFPSERKYVNKFGKEVTTYDLCGRVHLDYLELYMKHNPQQRLSYALNSIGQLEVKESKVQYTGSLDDLYKKDFKKFIEYNQQDVLLMVKIDRNKKYIELHNQIAHANYVILKTTMGSVSLVEQAIINEMHNLGFVAPNRKDEDEDKIIDDVGFLITDDDDEEDDDDDTNGHAPVVGAYVAQPKVGLHTFVGAVDINSLYPSAIRALNMSPETLVGQIRLDFTKEIIEERASKLPKVKKAEAWEGVFSAFEFAYMHEKDEEHILTVDFFDHIKGSIDTKKWTGKQLYDFIFNPANNVCITANGTIFRTDVEGIIPQLLAKWYAERKEMQGKEKDWKKKKLEATTEEEKADAEYLEGFWNQRQQARKILLNSLYGALLNEALRFYDERLGQSTTLTGRTIDRHMAATINQIILGIYDYKGDSIIYCDTDSAYFSAYEVLKDRPEYSDFEWTKENVIALYDMIADETNDTFAEFMQKTFNTSLKRGSIIRAGRELIGSSALFIRKKKYAILMFDKEGTRLDKDGPGELKVMGLDLKRADTPKYMQEFLEQLLMDLLSGKEKSEIYANIKAFRTMFKTRPAWEKGTPRKVSNLTKYVEQQKAIDAKTATLGGKRTIKKDEKLKVNMPGHVRASFNWNMLCEVNKDRFAIPITDGTRIIVCKLTKNAYGMTSVAYPIDEPHLPEWLMNLPFDNPAMETTIIDKKIKNVVGVLNWDLTDTIEKAGEEFFT